MSAAEPIVAAAATTHPRCACGHLWAQHGIWGKVCLLCACKKWVAEAWRICTDCNQNLPLSAFTIAVKRQRIDGQVSLFPFRRCKECRNTELRRRYNSDPEVYQATLHRAARWRYKKRRRA